MIKREWFCLTTEINIIDLLNVMIRKWWVIAISIMICGGGTYVYTDLFVEPMYRTDGSIYVNCETEAERVDVASSGRMESNARLAVTYVEILRARSFLTDVARDLNNKYSYAQIQNMLTIQPVNETELLKITIEGTDAADVCKIVESILQRAGEQLMTIVKAGTVEIVDEPYVPIVPFSPNKSRNTLFGALAGAVLAVGFLFLMELFDTHVKNADEIRQRYSEPVLGEIPTFSFQ